LYTHSFWNFFRIDAEFCEWKLWSVQIRPLVEALGRVISI
jgi:hypothetical protein